MKPTILSISLASALCAATTTSTATAQTQHLSIEAPVVSTTAIVRTVTDKIPHRSCRDQLVRVEQAAGYRSRTPSVLGAVLGGLAGGALGDNTGHQGVIAGAGALLGATIGRDAQQKRATQSRYVNEEVCEVDYELRDREEVTGYRVAYQYGDSIYHTQTTYDPGATISLDVVLQPNPAR